MSAGVKGTYGYGNRGKSNKQLAFQAKNKKRCPTCGHFIKLGGGIAP